VAVHTRRESLDPPAVRFADEATVLGEVLGDVFEALELTEKCREARAASGLDPPRDRSFLFVEFALPSLKRSALHRLPPFILKGRKRLTLPRHEKDRVEKSFAMLHNPVNCKCCKPHGRRA
jgi:hypothetical protein